MKKKFLFFLINDRNYSSLFKKYQCKVLFDKTLNLLFGMFTFVHKWISVHIYLSLITTTYSWVDNSEHHSTLEKKKNVVVRIVSIHFSIAMHTSHSNQKKTASRSFLNSNIGNTWYLHKERWGSKFCRRIFQI